jgi:hypothetical protein
MASSTRASQPARWNLLHYRRKLALSPSRHTSSHSPPNLSCHFATRQRARSFYFRRRVIMTRLPFRRRLDTVARPPSRGRSRRCTVALSWSQPPLHGRPNRYDYQEHRAICDILPARCPFECPFCWSGIMVGREPSHRSFRYIRVGAKDRTRPSA